MHKRHFLAAAAGAVTAPAWPLSPTAPAGGSPALLTVSGAVGRTNRGPLDPQFDQLMAKQKLRFERAHAFDFPTLAALPATAFTATLEYDGKPHRLAGPTLVSVLEQAGATMSDGTQLVLRAIDGYAVGLTVAEARALGYIVALRRDDAPLPLGGLGPLWAVYSPDRHADLMARPIAERYAKCPWGLYHLEVVGT